MSRGTTGVLCSSWTRSGCRSPGRPSKPLPEPRASTPGSCSRSAWASPGCSAKMKSLTSPDASGSITSSGIAHGSMRFTGNRIRHPAAKTQRSFFDEPNEEAGNVQRIDLVCDRGVLQGTTSHNLRRCCQQRRATEELQERAAVSALLRGRATRKGLPSQSRSQNPSSKTTLVASI